MISPDIPSKTVASLHTVGQGCRVPLLVNWKLKLKIGHVMKALRKRGCPHTQKAICRENIASDAFSNGDLEKTGPANSKVITWRKSEKRIRNALQK